MGNIIAQLQYVIEQNDPDCCKAVLFMEECQKIMAVIKAAPRDCICHVKSYDGYYGTRHSNYCSQLSNALKELEEYKWERT